MLDENTIFVPVENFRGQLESLKDSDEFTEPHVTGTQENLTLLTSDDFVESRSDVKINSRKVNFSQVAGIVHMRKNHVHVSRSANSWNHKTISASGSV